MLRLALLLIAVVANPAAAFHDSNLDPRLKSMLDQMMRADPARAQMYQQQGNMLAAMGDRCQRGDRNACTMFEKGSQEVQQWAKQMGGGIGSVSQGGQSGLPPSQPQSASGGAPTKRGAVPPPLGKGPTPISQVSGNRCNALAPQGWRVVDERKEGDGVDFASPDATLGAGYLIVGIPAMMLRTYGGTPENSVKYILSKFGQMPTQFSSSQNTETGFKVIEWRNQGGRGLALWYTFPLQRGDSGFVLVVRSGVVTPQGNEQRLREAVAVATSIRCTVALRPPPPADWTSRSNPGRKKPRSDDEAASDYNVQLGMEHVHDKRTGENYWVSPSTDYRTNGPEGAGYYKQVGNETRKLAPGRSD